MRFLTFYIMATISETKEGGKNCFSQLARESQTLVIIVNVGLNYLTSSDGSKREFIHHFGAYAPFSSKAANRFFRAIAGSGLLRQLQQVQGENNLSKELKRLDYSIVQGSLVYKDLYKCQNPQETIRDFLQFVIAMTAASKSRKICFILKDETQVKYFNDFFVNIFSRFSLKLRSIMCTSLDSILKCVKSNYNIEELVTLQAAQDKGQDLDKLLMSKSDLMCVSLFESFCIILSIDSNGKSLQLLLKQILQCGGVEQKKEKQKISSKIEGVDEQTNPATEHKFLPESKLEEVEAKEELLLAAAASANLDPATAVTEGTSLHETSELAESYQLKYDIKEEQTENELQDKAKLEQPLTSSPLEVTDHLMSEASITLFIKTDFLENIKQRMTVKNLRQPLFIQCLLHPSGKELLLGFKPAGTASSNKKLYEVSGKTVRYIGHPGLKANCYPNKMTFELLTSFVKETRKQNPSKQFNVFVREFESFNKLMGFPEWRELLGSLDTLVTLYSRASSSLARVPDLPLTEMASYLNNILSTDTSCVLHREHVTSVFSGLNV